MKRGVDIWQRLPEGARRLALALLAVQIVIVAIHLTVYYATLDHLNPKGARGLLDFNQEGSLQTYWSALVMATAGIAALDASRPGPADAKRSLAWMLIGLGFLWLGAEELISLHEDIQVASGVDWPVIYLPALLVGSWAIVRATAELESALRPALIAGLVCLVFAVGAELLSSPSLTLDFALRNLIEENLELGGASIVLVVAVAHGQRLRSDPEPGGALVEPRSTL